MSRRSLPIIVGAALGVLGFLAASDASAFPNLGTCSGCHLPDPTVTISVTLLVPNMDYIGMAMFHCHILEHEDIGMLGLWDIMDGGPM